MNKPIVGSTNLGAILSALASMTEADLDGPRFVKIEPRKGQSVEEAVAEYQAKHRETCAGCAAEYKAQAELAEKEAAKAMNKAAQPAPTGYTEDGSAIKPDAPTQQGPAGIVIADIGGGRFVVQAPVNGALEVNAELFATPLAAEVPPLRIPIGFMAFAMKNDVMTPVVGSFNVNSAVVHANLARFNELDMLKTLREMAGALGQSLSSMAEVRPVYAD